MSEIISRASGWDLTAADVATHPQIDRGQFSHREVMSTGATMVALLVGV